MSGGRTPNSATKPRAGDAARRAGERQFDSERQMLIHRERTRQEQSAGKRADPRALTQFELWMQRLDPDGRLVLDRTPDRLGKRRSRSRQGEDR
jgi:hypothetical protein